MDHLKILRTERTESTGIPPVFRYTVTGEVAWPNGCNELGAATTAGAKERFKKEVTLAKTDDGRWQ